MHNLKRTPTSSWDHQQNCRKLRHIKFRHNKVKNSTKKFCYHRQIEKQQQLLITSHLFTTETEQWVLEYTRN